jgi:hypothetical protein
MPCAFGIYSWIIAIFKNFSQNQKENECKFPVSLTS